MKKIAITCLAALLCSCGAKSTGMLTEVGLDRDVRERLEAKAAILPDLSALEMTPQEREALEFLYAYMPVGDIGDYSAEFFLKNVKSSLKAREELGYDAVVSTSDFLHFVLPLRVNNEMLDTSRIVFYNALKDRVKGLSMEDAVKEVNHWSNQMAVYMPTDARTASPLSVQCSAGGRCGEQSVFVVAALKAVGIPARQIYVPRWSHVDDNHAWVEAWIGDENGGKWHYLGACEPEAELNAGWFDAAATRAPLMVTDVFGKYNTEREVLSETACYSEINVTDNYAPVTKGYVQVLDASGTAQRDAQVIFTIFNYGEFYPTVLKTTNSEGVAELIAGRGDMAVFASKDGEFAQGVFDFRMQDDTLKLTLNSLPTQAVEYDITPAPWGDVPQRITPEAREKNNERLAKQNALRAEYVATFPTEEYAENLAKEIGASEQRVVRAIQGSRGNYSEIEKFLRASAQAQNLDVALDLLEVVPVKDLRDTPCEVFLDHLNGSLSYKNYLHFTDYILNPRIGTETLTAYRKVFSEKTDTRALLDIIKTVESTIIEDDTQNPNLVPITPLGVDRIKIADSKSKKAYLVAMIRSAGFPARIESTTNLVQFYNNKADEWVYTDQYVDLYSTENTNKKIALGKVKFHYTPTQKNPDPKMGLNFTLARWNGKMYEKLNIGAELLAKLGVDMGAGATFSTLFSEAIELPVGSYMLTTATRMEDGTVLSRLEPFTVAENQTSDVVMVLREADKAIKVIDHINTNSTFIPLGATSAKSLQSAAGEGYFVVALIDAKAEPTTHMLRDLNKQLTTLEKWGQPLLLIFSDEKQAARFNRADYPTLPSTVTLGYDNNSEVTRMIKEELEINDISRLPVVALVDDKGSVYYTSTGYNTALGEQLRNLIEKL